MKNRVPTVFYIERNEDRYRLRLTGWLPEDPSHTRTLRQRLRLWRAGVAWRTHDWLFPRCPGAGAEWE